MHFSFSTVSSTARTFLIVIFAIAFLDGCSNLDPVPAEVADVNGKASGIRYFETRPFVVVNKPFPLESDSVLVDGYISADGKHIYIDNIPVTNSAGIRHFHINQDQKKGFEVGKIVLLKPSAVTTAAKAQGSSGEGDKVGNMTMTDPKKEDDKEKDSTSTAGKQGTSNITIITDNTGIPLITVNEYLSLIYLNDFDREYVLSTKAKLGVKNIHLTLGPGATLQGIDASVDNSAIVGPLVSAWTSLINTGTQALVAAVSPGGAAAAVAQGSSSDSAVAPQELRSRPITLRIHNIKYATIGIYPIVKSGEVEDYAEDKKGVIKPTVAYQIPYRYFELLVVEPLLVTEPLGFVANPSSASTPNNSSVDCTGYIIKEKVTDEALSFIIGSKIHATQSKGANAQGSCYKKVSFVVGKGDTAPGKKLSESEKQKVKSALKKRFANLEVELKDPS